jgi:O-antigen ligase
MELFLLKFVALFRPLVSLNYAATVFEVAGSALFGALIVALLAIGAVRKSLKFSFVDAAIITFTLWCLAIYIIYFESARLKEVAKLVIPLLSYIAVKNVVRNRQEYEALLRWILVGFAVPIALSMVLILNGSGVDYVSYWTNLERWRGAYEGAHSLGHSMALFLIILAIYANFTGIIGAAAGKEGRKLPEKLALLLLAAMALYCLYMSQVRSAVVGLITFTSIYLFFINRKLLFIAAASVGAVAVLTVPVWLPALLPEFAMREKGIAVETMELGSGRPSMWLNDLIVFAQSSIDQQLAGVGIGNRGQDSEDFILYGHNDWLELLTQTGIVGVVIFAWLQIAILRTILKLAPPEKYLFGALFGAVTIMMLVSNSYAWRIQVSQLYYMVLAYIEIRQSRAALSDSVNKASTANGPLERYEGVYK